MSRHQITLYARHAEKLLTPKRFAVVADLHNGTYRDILPDVQGVDAVLIVGDLLNRHRLGTALCEGFLRDASKLAPLFFSVGNHERRSPEANQLFELLERYGVTVLDDAWVRFSEDLVIGGFSSRAKWKPTSVPDRLTGMGSEVGFRLLLCHHPEYYPSLVQPLGFDLTLAGHAHGGQIQLFGRGLYAPGQGLLPKLTHGWYDHGHLLISRGMTNSANLPRWNNPCEMILLDLLPGKEAFA